MDHASTFRAFFNFNCLFIVKFTGFQIIWLLTTNGVLQCSTEIINNYLFTLDSFPCVRK